MLPSYICPEVYGPWLFESGRLTKREGWISSLFPFTLFSMHRLCFTGSKLVGLVCNWDFRFVLGSLLTRRWNLLLSSSRDFACWKFSLQELSLNSESHFVQFCFLKAASFFFFSLFSSWIIFIKTDDEYSFEILWNRTPSGMLHYSEVFTSYMTCYNKYVLFELLRIPLLLICCKNLALIHTFLPLIDSQSLWFFATPKHFSSVRCSVRCMVPLLLLGLLTLIS